MCVFYALKLWLQKGGKLLFIFQPSFHVIVCSSSGIFHGTNKNGKWKVEQIDAASFTRWLLK